MSEKTEIAWTDATWNPWRGCDKVSPGCKNCYAEKLVNGRLQGDFSQRVIASDATFDAPLKWNKKPWICDLCGYAAKEELSNCPGCGGDLTGFHRRRVFSLSLGDWLDLKIPIPVLARALSIIHRCQDIDFLLCTKRPELFYERLSSVLTHFAIHGGGTTGTWLFDWLHKHKDPPKNVWIIASAEDQQRFNERRKHLLKIPAVIHGWSLEPLLGPISLENDNPQDHGSEWAFVEGQKYWVIVGGESGKNARPCNVEWIRSIKEQCQSAGVPVFVKQCGSHVLSDAKTAGEWHGTTFRSWDEHVARRITLNHPKGGDPEEWPSDLRVRQFPSVTHA